MPARDKNRLGTKEKHRSFIESLIDFLLDELEQEEMTLSRNEQSIKIVRQSFCFKLRVIYRPMQIILGVFLSLIALLIFISLFLSNINKCIHFTSFQQIFAQGNKTLPNPIDIILTWTGGVSQTMDSFSIEFKFFFFKYYPMSYIVLCLLLVYIIFTSIFGLQQLGIWMLCVRVSDEFE